MCACVFFVFYYVLISIAASETCVIKREKGDWKHAFSNGKEDIFLLNTSSDLDILSPFK